MLNFIIGGLNIFRDPPFRLSLLYWSWEIYRATQKCPTYSQNMPTSSYKKLVLWSQTWAILVPGNTQWPRSISHIWHHFTIYTSLPTTSTSTIFTQQKTSTIYNTACHLLKKLGLKIVDHVEFFIMTVMEINMFLTFCYFMRKDKPIKGKNSTPFFSRDTCSWAHL